MEKILLVDDDKRILSMIERALAKENRKIFALESSKKVLSFDLSHMNLIILDIMMPEIDGFDLIQAIRQEANCPILFLSALKSEETIIEGLGLGADDFLSKPFSIYELRARVEAHLRRDAREPVKAFQRQDFTFDLLEKRVEFEKEDLDFTSLEFEVTYLLAKSPGQVYSREQILTHVLGYTSDTSDEAIYEHIKNIRHKCKKRGINPIETVWGIGYKWKNQ